MVVSTVQKVWKSGSSICVNVPKKVQDIKDIDTGDFVQISWGDVTKQADLKKEEKKVKRKKIKEEDNQSDIEQKIREIEAKRGGLPEF